MSIETVSEATVHGGVQGVYRHASTATGTDMTFSVFMPPQPEKGEPLPVLWYLSGLTCTQANVTEKGEFRAACAHHRIVFVAPDTAVVDQPVAAVIGCRNTASENMAPMAMHVMNAPSATITQP